MATTDTTHLDTTVGILEEHVKSESTTGVSSSISSWIKTLSAHKEFKGIADDLEDLKEAVSKKDGKKIVDLMTKLGADTTKAAEGAEGDEAKRVKLLGKALTTAAKGISKLVK